MDFFDELEDTVSSNGSLFGMTPKIQMVIRTVSC